MFLMKKIVSRFFFPVPLSLELLFAGVFLLWFTRKQRAGKALVTAGALLLLGLSNSFTSDVLLRPLEHQYPPLAVGHIGTGTPATSFIMVLGGWADDDPTVPITSHISPHLMVRLIEGVCLQREIPGSKLILSGNNDSAQGMAVMAQALGVGSADLVRLSEPRDTEEESQQIAPLVGHHPFILVTSASHMPRAMLLFRRRSLQPLAAPTDYFTPRHRLEFDDFVPDAYKLLKAQTAFYEYLGLAYETLRARF
jgi:uncharacterized SAM-binding protein YcdF (DUF218 family)